MTDGKIFIMPFSVWLLIVSKFARAHRVEKGFHEKRPEMMEKRVLKNPVREMTKSSRVTSETCPRDRRRRVVELTL